MVQRTCRQSTVLLVFAFALMPMSATAQDTNGKRPLTLDDYGAVEGPGSVAMSPDGKRVVYTQGEQLYLVTGEEPPRVLSSSAHGAEGARWSANGKWVYLLSDRGAGTQVYRLPTGHAGEAQQVTEFEHGVASLNLSPDETKVLLSVSDDELREEPEGPVPIVVTRRHFKRDAGNGYITDGTLNHLYVYDVDSGDMRRLTSGPFDDSGAAWSPDGSKVVFTSNRQDVPDTDYRSDLFVVDVAENERTPLRLTDDAHTKSSPVWSPDGRQIAYLTAEDGVYAISRIALLPAGGGKPRILTADFDRSISSIDFSPDGDWIYFNYPDSGTMPLARVRVADGYVETLLDGERVVGSFDVGASGEVALTMRAGIGGGDVFRLQDGDAVRLTDLNREFFAGVALGDKTKVSIESTGGTRIDAFITKPPGYREGRSYPLILKIHGGPVDQFTWGYGFNTQYMASRGYVVIEPNPRGSSGRGQDFVRTIFRAWGIPDYEDVMAAVEHAVTAGIADEERLFVTGYSYGGYMTNVIITQSDRFRAAVSGAGHSLIEANVGHDIYSQWYMWEFGPPWGDRAIYDQHSPLLRAANVSTPTLFYCGRVDWNVPLLNSELFYQALQFRGIESELVVYPDMHHGGWSDEFEKDSLERTIGWFDSHGGAR